MEPLIEFNERGETGRPLDERGRMIDPDPERLREIRREDSRVFKGFIHKN